MKSAIYVVSLLSLVISQRMEAQVKPSPAFFTGIQLVNISTGKNARQPVFQLHEEESLFLAKKILFSADINLMKNTIPVSQYKGKVLEFFQFSAPIHFDYLLHDNYFLEGGVYVGAIARSGNVYITEFVQVKYFETLQAFWDTGFIAGISYRLKKFGKMSFRYNHGLIDSVPTNEDKIVKNRMLALVLTATF